MPDARVLDYLRTVLADAISNLKDGDVDIALDELLVAYHRVWPGLDPEAIDLRLSTSITRVPTVPDKYEDRLKDYVDVKERIRLFYERFPDGRLVTADARHERGPRRGGPGVGQGARLPHPRRPAAGRRLVYMAVPGTTPYTRGVRDREHRDVAPGGGPSARSASASPRASRRPRRSPTRPASRARPRDEALPHPTRSRRSDRHAPRWARPVTRDFELRETPEGWALGFRLRGERAASRSLARDAIALGPRGVQGETIGAAGHLLGPRARRDVHHQGRARDDLPGARPRAHHGAHGCAARRRRGRRRSRPRSPPGRWRWTRQGRPRGPADRGRVMARRRPQGQTASGGLDQGAAHEERGLDMNARAEVAAAWVAGWFERQNLPPSMTVHDDELVRRGREYARLAIPAPSTEEPG